jgi:hypothetical protein
MKSRRISGSTSTQSSSDKGKHSRAERGRHRADDPSGVLPTDNHKQEDCKFRNHPDFNERGQWDGSVPDRAMRKWQGQEKD